MFHDTSSAAGGNFTIEGGEVDGAFPGTVVFYDSSSAGNATFDTDGGIYFFGNSTGGSAEIRLNSNGYLDISGHNAPGITIGSLESSNASAARGIPNTSQGDDGDVYLGANTLTIDIDFDDFMTFSGSITDGNEDGSLTITGGGHAFFTAGMTFNGTFTIDGRGNKELEVEWYETPSVGLLDVIEGLLKEIRARIEHDVNIHKKGTVTVVNAVRGVPPNRPYGVQTDPVLDVGGNYIQEGGGTLELEIGGTDPPSFAKIQVAGGITLLDGAILDLNFVNGFAPHAGDTFNIFSSSAITGSFNTVNVTGLAPGFQYNIAPDGNGHLQLIALNDGQPLVQSAVSRKTHGAAGIFDTNLPFTGTPGVECRNGGATNDFTIIVTCATNVNVTGSPQAEVSVGTGCIGSAGTCTGNVSINGNIVTIPLTNITNAQTINVRLNGVSSAVADAPGTDFTVPMSILIGDTNGNGAVNASDVALAKSRIGQSINATNFRADVNANGTINATDVSIVKSRVGGGLP